MNIFIETITSADPEKRNRSFFELSRSLGANQLLKDLREQGILAPGYGSLRVMDAQRLQDASRN